MEAPSRANVSYFKHDALPDAANHIRLLEVLDDNYSETIKIRCRMATWPVDAMPSYHAISYTWGDLESNMTILINDKTFRVRMNCEFALKQAYWYGKSCYYWVDAVCIDQGNLEEKGKQVAMMGMIYKSADHVLACVGDHADDSLFFYRKLAWANGIFKKVRYDSNIFRIIFRRHGISTAYRFLHAALDFAKRPYFSRLWVVQELRNAKESNLVCGPDIVPKEDVLRVYLHLHGAILNPRSKPLSILVSFVWRLRAVVHPRATVEDRGSAENMLSNLIFITGRVDSAHLKSALFRVSHLQSTHSRDKLYGIIPIFDWGDIVPPVPDYTKPDLEVALDFVRPMFDILHRIDEHLDPSEICHNIARLLNLGDRSEGVLDAIEARSGTPEKALASLRLPIDASSTQMRSLAKGWRLTSEHFISRNPSFSLWKFPANIKSKASLPPWVEAGNWILQIDPEPSYYFGLLVLGELSDGFASSIMGQGTLDPFRSTGSADSNFHIFWDTEDLLLCNILDRGEQTTGFTDDDQIKTGICKRQNPGSSYAIRLDFV